MNAKLLIFQLPAFTVSGILPYNFHWMEMIRICCGLIFTMKRGWAR